MKAGDSIAHCGENQRGGSLIVIINILNLKTKKTPLSLSKDADSRADVTIF